MNRHRFATAALIACALAWATIGTLKLFHPRPIHLAGLELDDRWATAIGLVEIGLASALLLDFTRARARYFAFGMLALFAIASLTAAGADCGCLGAVQLDRATREVLLGGLLLLHGLESIARSRPSTPGLAPQSRSLDERIAHNR